MSINKESIMTAIGHAKTAVKSASPEILMVTGVVGGVVGAVMACKATTKLDTILEKSKQNVETIKKVAENPDLVEEEYTPEDAKKDLAITYVKTGLELIKLYGPAIIIAGLSITAIFASNNIMRKRNVALAAAYATIDRSFKEYKDRVIDRFGEEVDRELTYNLKDFTYKEEETDENGKTKTVKKKVKVTDGSVSPHDVFFDSCCIGWTKDHEANKKYIKLLEGDLTRKLHRDGILLLNDVYTALGLPRTTDGMVLGWICDAKNPVGAQEVDFDVYNMYRETNRDFVNGYENVVLLHMDVVNVYDAKKKRERKVIE